MFPWNGKIDEMTIFFFFLINTKIVFSDPFAFQNPREFLAPLHGHCSQVSSGPEW